MSIHSNILVIAWILRLNSLICFFDFSNRRSHRSLRMNILLITQDFPPKLGGIETYSYQLAKQWHLSGYKVVVVTVSQSKFQEEEKIFDAAQPFIIERIKAPNPILLAVLIKSRLKGLVAKYRIDTLFHSQWLTAVKSCKLKAKGAINNVFVAIHGRELVFNPYQSVPFLAQWYRAKMRYVFKNCTHIFSNSNYTASVLNDIGLLGYDKTKTTVSALGVEPEQFKPIPREQAFETLGIDKIHLNKVIVLNLARLIHRKGADLTLKALANLKERNSTAPFYFLIAGDGPFLKELKEMTKTLAMSENVQFVGKMFSHQLSAVYSASDIFVMPSRSNKADFEGYGIVYLEAALNGLPSIGCNSGGIPDAIVDKQTGYLVEQENVEELSQKLELLINDKALRQAIGEKGKERAKKMSWANISQLIATKMSEFS